MGVLKGSDTAFAWTARRLIYFWGWYDCRRTHR